jgi:photosystem II stability/assembly factor-like uncharacterized protein
VWKIFGRAADDAWLVGSRGVSLSWDGTALVRGDTGVGASLFTVHANSSRYVAVGGEASGIIVEHDGAAWHNLTPDPAPGASLAGIFVNADDSAFAAGNFGTVYERVGGSWRAVDTGLSLAQNLHAVWVDPEGGVWAVGGQTFSPALNEGVLIHRGRAHPMVGTP